MTARDDPEGELPPELVDAALDRWMGADPENRATVETELLAAHAEHRTLLRRLFADLRGGERVLDASFQDDDPPPRIRGYRVIRRIGEGAFGVVHLCEQTEPVSRRVAIKVLRPGTGDRSTLRRFEAERQLLASLNHRSISQIFDAGELEDGRPYFVMEYIDGLPLTTFCEEGKLDCDARLRLFIELCLGIEHAHARGIVHRDLKPANVLVVESVPAPQPKVIDFGVAKALQPVTPTSERLSGATEPGRVIGTPGYMSPEQARGQIDEVDVRSDVFALGVMLYELLAGEAPFDRDGADPTSEPERPSSRVLGSRSDRGALQPTERQRRAARIRGDLDWITLTAVAPERERRYQSVRDLIDDLERHRAGRPVRAGPPSVSYRIAKFVRRNRVAVLAAAAALLATAVGVGIATVHALEADEGHRLAKLDADSSFEDATMAARKLLQRATDERTQRLPQSDAMRELLLQDAIDLYDRWLARRPEDPRLQAPRCEALTVMSTVYWQLGRMEDAERLAEEAISVATALLADAPTDIPRRELLAAALRGRSSARASLSRTKEALGDSHTATAHLEACFAADAARYGAGFAASLRDEANLLQALSRRDESLRVNERAFTVLGELAASAPVGSTIHRDHSLTAIAYAQQLMFVGRPADAEKVLCAAEARLDRVAQERQRVIAAVHNLLAQIQESRGDREPALLHAMAAMAAAEAWASEEPDHVLPNQLHYQCTRLVGIVEDGLGRYDDATRTLQKAIDLARAAVDRFPKDPTQPAVLAAALHDFARIVWDRYRRCDLETAEEWARLAVDWRAKVAPSVDPRRTRPPMEVRMLVAQIRDSRGTDTAAEWEAIATSLAAATEPTFPPGPIARAEAWTGIARSRFRHGRFDDAATALAEPHQAIDTQLQLTYQLKLEIARLDADLAVARGDSAAAAATAERMVAIRPTWMGRTYAGHALRRAWLCAGAGADADGYRDAADELFQAARASLRPQVETAPDDAFVAAPYGFATLAEAQIAATRGEDDRARELLSEALPLLRRVEPLAHRDRWDAEFIQQATALAERLGAAKSR